MNTYDPQYLALVKDVLTNGIKTPCRTGDNCYVTLNKSLTHDLSEGFPILTFRPLPFKGMQGELECFLNGITDKKAYQDAKCKYWDFWANPEKAPIADKQAQEEERDLGPIYGFQWRHFGAEYDSYDTDYTNKGVDQLQNVINTLKTNPYDRRMIINAWNPIVMNKMALPPCIYSFQFTYLDNKLHLSVEQRSADLILGVCTDFIFYSLLLTLVAKTVGMEVGTCHLHMVNCHIYENHVETIKENLDKPYFDLPKLILPDNCTVYNFKHGDATLDNYQHGEKLKFMISV